MKAIIVDDEMVMVKGFMRYTAGIKDLDVVAGFDDPIEALDYLKSNKDISIVFFDIEMPRMTGLELAKKVRELYPEMLLVFITAFTEYVQASNQLGADYYIIKPYKKETIISMMERMRLLVKRQTKSIFVKTFGEFEILKDGKPLSPTGKGKEVLAYCVAMRGREASNDEIFTAMWEGRENTNTNRKVYYNSLTRLKEALRKDGLADMLVSTTHGQYIKPEYFECDFYDWLDKNKSGSKKLPADFMNGYSWGDKVLSILGK